MDRESPSRLFLGLTAVALAIGIYARFKGLGFAPVSPDEYYLARAIDGIIKHGVPAFDCGGLYQRGLGLQYLIAAIRSTGFSVELSSRVVTATASLLTLPAVYLIGRRFVPANLALVAVAVLALSMWEIELARFGRMYAPFQAVFAWYVVAFLRYTVDRDRRALKWMLALTAVGALTWEGGALLALLNFAPAVLSYAESGRLHRDDWLSAAVALPLVALAYAVTKLNLRFQAGAPPYPEGFSSAMTQLPPAKLDLVRLPAFDSLSLPLAVLFAVLLLAACALSLPWIWSERRRPLAALGLAVTLTAALTHQFVLVLAIPVCLVLLNQIALRELAGAKARLFLAAVGGAASLWLVWGVASLDWGLLVAQAGSPARAAATFVYQYLRFPDVINVVVGPFMRAVPGLALILGAGLIALIGRQLLVVGPLRTPERVISMLVIVLLLAVGLSNPPRFETRYVAFLYPLAVLFVVVALAYLWKPQITVPVAALVLFALAGDISYHHIRTVDTPDTTFRIGMNQDLQSHLEIRDDVRGVAEWLRPRVASPDTVVINGVHGFDYYFADTKYFFVDEHDPNFPDWSCRRGTVDRWTNLPLIWTFAQLKDKTAGFSTAYVVMFTPTSEQLSTLQDWHATIVLTKGLVSVVELHPPASQATVRAARGEWHSQHTLLR